MNGRYANNYTSVSIRTIEGEPKFDDLYRCFLVWKKGRWERIDHKNGLMDIISVRLSGMDSILEVKRSLRKMIKIRNDRFTENENENYIYLLSITKKVEQNKWFTGNNDKPFFFRNYDMTAYVVDTNDGDLLCENTHYKDAFERVKTYVKIYDIHENT